MRQAKNFPGNHDQLCLSVSDISHQYLTASSLLKRTLAFSRGDQSAHQNQNSPELLLAQAGIQAVEKEVAHHLKSFLVRE